MRGVFDLNSAGRNENENKKIRILALVGPTASGKTALSLFLAELFSGEIISCDSMQIYRGMDIGTAKPSVREMRGIPHHMIDVADPEDDFSVADYVRLAGEAVSGIVSRGHLPVFCGGTGLYLDSFLRGGGLCETGCDPALREALRREAEEHGNKAIHARLAAVDPESAAAIHPNNLRRVIRALEIFETTGKTKSELDRLSRIPASKYDPVIIGLRFSDRSELYRRIDQRVDKMLSDGLLEETRRLYLEGVFERSKTAAQAIGYKELLGCIRGEATISEAAEELKKSTRHYAKRQLTWFEANPAVRWIEAGGGRSFGDIAAEAAEIWKRNQNDKDV